MDFRSLSVFVEAAELGSFTRAGQKLGYSQPTVSFQIKQLEQELGVPLFERIGHTVTLTQEGRFALVQAQKILRTCQEMVHGADNTRQPTGTVRMGTADSLCSPLVAHHFGSFRRKFPGVNLKLQTAGTEALLELLDHNEADVICTLDRRIYDTAYVTDSEERVGVHFVTAPADPLASRGSLSLQDLTDVPMLLTEKDMSYCRMLHERLAREDIEIRPVLESGNADLLCQLAEQGLGISFLPDFVTERAVREGRLVRLDVRDLEIDLWQQVMYRKEKWVSLPIRALLGHLAAIRLESLSIDERGKK